MTTHEENLALIQINKKNDECGKQYFLPILAFSFSFVCGCSVAYPSPVLPILVKEGLLSEYTKTWYASLLSIGAIFGGPIAGYISRCLGRKKCILFTTLPLCLGWHLTNVAEFVPKNYAFIFLLISRIFAGMGFSMAILVCTTYMNESVSKDKRGLYSTFFSLGISSAILTMYGIGNLIHWSTTTIICVVPLIITICVTIYSPESPRWLIQNNKYAEGIDSLTWLRGSRRNSVIEGNEILNSLEKEDNKKPTFYCKMMMMQSRKYYKPFIICLFLHIIQQLTFINGILSYSNEILIDAGYRKTDLLPLMTIGSIQLIASILCTLLLDKCGRRPLLLVSILILFGSLLSFGIYYNVAQVSSCYKFPKYIVVIVLATYLFGFNLGLAIIPWTIMTEILPPITRDDVASFITILNWTLAFITTKIFIGAQKYLTTYGFMYLNAIFTFFGFIFVIVIVPETKHKSLEEIQNSIY